MSSSSSSSAAVSSPEAGAATRTDYPVIRGSHRSNRLEKGEGVSAGEFSGTAIECSGGNVTAAFTNAKGEALQTIAVN